MTKKGKNTKTFSIGLKPASCIFSDPNWIYLKEIKNWKTLLFLYFYNQTYIKLCNRANLFQVSIQSKAKSLCALRFLLAVLCDRNANNHQCSNGRKDRAGLVLLSVSSFWLPHGLIFSLLIEYHHKHHKFSTRRTKTWELFGKFTDLSLPFHFINFITDVLIIFKVILGTKCGVVWSPAKQKLTTSVTYPSWTSHREGVGDGSRWRKMAWSFWGIVKGNILEK